MNNLLIKLVLFGLLLMLVIAPFAGVAPIMLILLGFGIVWIAGSFIQVLITGTVEEEDKQAG
jgi:hypothetical protein